MKPTDMLRFYAEHFGAVEINNTFYRMPEKDLIRSWMSEVPSEFKFALKAPQKITHLRRLKNVEDDLAHFLDVASVLKQQLGPLLFQFPGNFKKDAARLDDFLKLLPGKTRAAFEFREASWFDDEIFAMLRKHNAALCIAESGETVQVPFEATADWGYLRLRRLDYQSSDLKKWFGRVQKQKWSEAHVFFRHEDRALGPKFAQIFLKFIKR
jgi:uncharacterized protein YecE (DUF72 family)